MNKYLQSILVFDLALPALLIGLPCCALLFGVTRFQSFVAERTSAQADYEAQSLQVARLSAELQPMKAKVSILKGILSSADIESKLSNGITAALEKSSQDEIEQTLHDFDYGASIIGPSFGEGNRLLLKLSSRWEPLNKAAVQWETHFPNLVLESLAIDMDSSSVLSGPYLQSTLSYFVITEN